MTSSAQRSRRQLAVVPDESGDVGIVRALEIHCRSSQPVVPPDGDGIALHQLEKPLENGFLEDRTRGAPVGVGSGKERIGAAITEVAVQTLAGSGSVRPTTTTAASTRSPRLLETAPAPSGPCGLADCGSRAPHTAGRCIPDRRSGESLRPRGPRTKRGHAVRFRRRRRNSAPAIRPTRSRAPVPDSFLCLPNAAACLPGGKSGRRACPRSCDRPRTSA